MSLIATTVEWHDLAIDPSDLPGEEEPVFVTVENPLGERVVWNDAYMKFSDDGENVLWVCTYKNEFGFMEEAAVWYSVVAWAYMPEPYYV